MTDDTGDQVQGSRTGGGSIGDVADVDAIATAVGEGVYRLDPSGRFLAVNDVILEITGYDREEVIGEHVSLVVGEDDVDAFESAIQSMLEDETETGTGTERGSDRLIGVREMEIVSATGDRVVCEVRFTVLRRDGRFEGTAGVVRDVTERTVEYEAVERQRERLRSELDEVLGRVSDAFFALDADGRFTYVNDRAAELLEHDADALVGRRVRDVVSDPASVPFVQTALEAMETGDPVAVEEFYARLSAWFDVRVYPSASGVSVYLEDVTRRKAFEETLETLHEASRELHTADTADDVSRVVVRTLVDVLGLSAATLFRYDDEMETLVPEHRAGDGDVDTEEMPTLPANDESLAGHVFQEGEFRDFDDVLETPYVDDTVTDIRAALYAPLGDYGILVVDSSEPGTFDEYAAHLVELLAQNAGAAYDAREQARERVESEKRYRTLVEHFPNGAVALYDEELRLTAIGGDIYDDVDASVEGVEGTTIRQRLPPDLYERLEPALRGAFDGASDQLEVHAEGRDFWVHTLPVWDDDEGVIAGMVMAQDVTERKAHERELDRFRTIVENVNDGVYTIDAEGYITMVNGAYARMVGYSRDQLVGMHATELVSEDVADRARELEERLLAGEMETASIAAELNTADGREVTAEATFAALPLEDGDYERVAVVRDVTERVERERELESRVEQQDGVTELGTLALETSDLDRLFDEAVSMVAETLDNEFCKVLELQPDGESLVLRSGVGWRDGLVGEGTVGTGDDSQAGHTLRAEEPIVVEDLETESRFSGPALLTSHGVRSGVSTIIGPRDDPWGVLGTHDTEPRTFDRHDVAFVQAVANILATAIDRASREREIVDQRNQMASLVFLSEVVHEIDQAVIRQSTREEIDDLVCEQLTEVERYAGAWIGDLDVTSETISPRVAAGVSLEELHSVAIDSGDEATGRSPTVVAAEERTPRIVHRSDGDVPFPTFARERGYRSVAAFPIAFEDIQYGVLTVFSEQEGAFEGFERTLLEQLGSTIGHAINAIDRKQALVSDSYTELEITLPDSLAALALPEGEVDGGEEERVIEVDGTVSAGDGAVIQYVTTSGLSPETFREAAMNLDAVTDVRRIGDGDEDGPPHRFEVTYADHPLASSIAAYGGRIELVRFDVPDMHVVVAIPRSADGRKIVEAVRADFPAARVDAQRTVTGERERPAEYRRTAEEDLTERQRAALMTAYYAGYFEWSRESTGEEIASTMGVSPSTFHQHLRAAQRKVFSSLFDDRGAE